MPYTKRLPLIVALFAFSLLLTLASVSGLAAARKAAASEPAGTLPAGEAATSTALSSTTEVAPLGHDFPIVIGKGKETQGKPGVAFDGSNFMVVWVELATYNIYGARVSWDGTVLDTSAISISIGLNEQTRQPSVGFDGTNFMVAWCAYRSGAWEVYASRVTTGGLVLDPDGVQLTTGGNALDRMPGVAFNGTNYQIVWRTPTSQIWTARVTPDLVNLDATAGVSVAVVGTNKYPAIAFDGANYMVVWHKEVIGNDIYGARITSDGVVLDPEGFLIYQDTDNQAYPVIGFNGQDYVVSWWDERPRVVTYNGSTYATRVATDTTVLDSPPILVFPRTRTSPQINCDGSDCLIVNSEEHDVPPYFRLTDAIGRRIARDGTILESQAIPVVAAFGHQFAPVVGYGNGRYLVAWGDTFRDPQPGVYGQLLEERAAAPTAAPLPPPASTRAHGEWSQESGPFQRYATAGLAFGANNAYLFGNDGAYHYTGTQWVHDPSQGQTWGSWASGPDDIWIGGWARIFYHFNGQEWEGRGGNSDGSVASGLWSAGPGDALWATADDGDILLHSDELGWQVEASFPPADLWDIWGTAADNIYAVGSKGTVVHFDGEDWQLQASIPTSQSLNGIWGSGPNDIFAVGDWGTILHYDGAGWNSQASGTTEHLFDVWGFDGADVYAAGYNGTVLHYDGTGWASETTNTSQDLLTVFGVYDQQEPIRVVWAAGRGTTVLKKTIPVARMAIQPPSGVAPVTVALTNTSTSSYTSSLWDLGDGVTSTLHALTHTYAVPGGYTVTLRIGWADWPDPLTTTGRVVVFAPVTAGFTAAPISGVAPLTVTFANTSTGDFTTSLWYFGDGYGSTATDPSHTYTTLGMYTVTLDVSGPGGTATETKVEYIRVLTGVYLPLLLRSPG